jgi:hypothetical protein
LSLGIGSIGDFDKGTIGLFVGYQRKISNKLDLSMKYATSLADRSNEIVTEIDMMAKTQVWAKVKKKPMRFRLVEAVDSSNHVVPYFANYPFRIRNQVRLDIGFSSVTATSPVVFSNFNDANITSQLNGSSFFSVLVGPTYTRTRSTKITVNDSMSKSVYSKIRLGVNVGYNLWSNLSNFEVCTEDSNGVVCLADDISDYSSLTVKKLGFGFDVGYTTGIADQQWLLSFDVQGRFRPWMEGDYFFFPTSGGSGKASFHQYSSKLLFMPRVSLGYVFR